MRIDEGMKRVMDYEGIIERVIPNDGNFVLDRKLRWEIVLIGFISVL